MAEIGIVPGQEFDRGKLPHLGHKLDPKLALLELVRDDEGHEARQRLAVLDERRRPVRTDFEQRAMVTLIGPGLNFPQDAIYPFSEKDVDGKEYDGSKHEYVMRFEKGQMPPVKGFWSLTMYDPDFFFVPNPIDRYSLSQRDTFVTNETARWTCISRPTRPARSKDANWLPPRRASSSRCSGSIGRRTTRPRSWMGPGPRPR